MICVGCGAAALEPLRTGGVAACKRCWDATVEQLDTLFADARTSHGPIFVEEGPVSRVMDAILLAIGRRPGRSVAAPHRPSGMVWKPARNRVPRRGRLPR